MSTLDEELARIRKRFPDFKETNANLLLRTREAARHFVGVQSEETFRILLDALKKCEERKLW